MYANATHRVELYHGCALILSSHQLDYSEQGARGNTLVAQSMHVLDAHTARQETLRTHPSFGDFRRSILPCRPYGVAKFEKRTSVTVWKNACSDSPYERVRLDRMFGQ